MDKQLPGTRVLFRYWQHSANTIMTPATILQWGRVWVKVFDHNNNYESWVKLGTGREDIAPWPADREWVSSQVVITAEQKPAKPNAAATVNKQQDTPIAHQELSIFSVCPPGTIVRYWPDNGKGGEYIGRFRKFTNWSNRVMVDVIRATGNTYEQTYEVYACYAEIADETILHACQQKLALLELERKEKEAEVEKAG